ncbi:MAG: hypothetical protein R3F61_17510 [Myxococcota bacterium]
MGGEGFEIALVFLGMSSLVAVPLGVLIGLPLLAWVARAWLRLEERKVELQQLQVSAQIREHAIGRLPEWVDTRNPDALLAWARADREMARLERH